MCLGDLLGAVLQGKGSLHPPLQMGPLLCLVVAWHWEGLLQGEFSWFGDVQKGQGLMESRKMCWSMPKKCPKLSKP